jgi:hypothetical protein
MIAAYYNGRGLDQEGVPDAGTSVELGLNIFVQGR